MIRNVIVSVTDKSGIANFARRLHQMGATIISTGKTAAAIQDYKEGEADGGTPVMEVASFTGFPEMLEGRVKTLHPKIASGILAKRHSSLHMMQMAEKGFPTIDMVVVNLYQFQQAASREGITLDELVEEIDIGGPTLLRAAAKNWRSVAVVSSPHQYQDVLAELRARGDMALSDETKYRLAVDAFRLTAQYDGHIQYQLHRYNSDGSCVPRPQFGDSRPATVGI